MKRMMTLALALAMMVLVGCGDSHEKVADDMVGILEETVVTGNRRVCFFEGPDGVKLEFLEMKK